MNSDNEILLTRIVLSHIYTQHSEDKDEGFPSLGIAKKGSFLQILLDKGYIKEVKSESSVGFRYYKITEKGYKELIALSV